MFSRHGLACFVCVLAGLLAAALIAASSREAAANWPNDPGYSGDWELWSFVPSAWQSHVTAENNRLGTGAHVDRAWARTTGDRRVLISVLDSGANWSNADLANKWHLNAGELPPP